MQLYQTRYDKIRPGIRLFTEGKNKEMLVDRDKLTCSDQLQKLIEQAYKSSAFEALKEFMEKVMVEQEMIGAIFCQSAEEIKTTEDPAVRKDREEFLQHLAEYFFDNIWQEDRREYSCNSLLYLNVLALKRDNRLLGKPDKS